MKSAHDQFLLNLSRVRDLGGLHASLATSTTSALDLSDLLRAQIVLAVSAFDTLIHELVRIGILEAASGARPVSKALQKFSVSYSGHLLSTTPGSGLSWLDAEVRNKHSFLTFQQPDKVADAIKLVKDGPVWDAVAGSLGRTVTDLKSELGLIVERRNKIAHEADADPSFPGTRWPISPADVSRAIGFIESVGTAIYGAM